MKLIVNIPKDEYKLLQNSSFHTVIEECVRNGTPIHDNTTNGDILLSMFDTATVYVIDEENDCIMICIDNNFYQKFRYSWWNAPYQKGGKE